MQRYYDKRSVGASAITNSVADRSARAGHGSAMLSSDQLLARLRSLRDTGETTNADLARLLGLPSSRIPEIFDGKRAIKIDEMKVLVEHFRLEDGISRLPLPANDDETVELIALDLSLSMGPGTLIEDFIEEERVRMSLAFIQAITRTPSDRLRLVRGIGESMEPTLRTGDRVMVDINERQLTRAHGIYWIDHLGTHGIKRLRASARGKVMIMSDNPTVPDFEADAADIRIEGRVIWFAREL